MGVKKWGINHLTPYSKVYFPMLNHRRRGGANGTCGKLAGREGGKRGGGGAN